MATLQMTIESSDDERQPVQKAQKKKGVAKAPIPDEVDQDIMLAGNSENLFADHQSSSDSDDDGLRAIRKNLDGSKGNIWSFNSQIKVDPSKQSSVAANLASGGEDTNDDTAVIEEQTHRSIQERVLESLQNHNIEIPEEMKNLNEDRVELEHQVQTTNAKEHYDKEDLIQFHELQLSKPLVRACSDMEYEHPTVI